jgi:2-dehydro-3-deoxyphosphogluconate aldolase / (4S)-4-hydroxy-2-oxoglutarate aldolase
MTATHHSATALMSRLAASPVVAILRAPEADRFATASQVLYEAGFRCLEFTLTTKGVLDAVHQVRSSLPDDLVLGVGTVRTTSQVHGAVAAGADFLVSQVFRRPLVEAAHELAVPFFPGALTPSEILEAWESGVPAVKVSPIGPVGGVEYFSQVRAPLPDVPLMPTGGVRLDEVTTYLQRGAIAVGLSGPLMGDSLDNTGDLAALRERASAVIQSLSDR